MNNRGNSFELHAEYRLAVEDFMKLAQYLTLLRRACPWFSDDQVEISIHPRWSVQPFILPSCTAHLRTPHLRRRHNYPAEKAGRRDA